MIINFADPEFLSKIEQVQEFCNYLISPLKNNYTLGNYCHIWQFLEVSIKLRTLAVLWTHFCVDKTADLGSFMDTFLMLRMLRKLLDLGSFMDTFPTE